MYKWFLQPKRIERNTQATPIRCKVPLRRFQPRGVKITRSKRIIPKKIVSIILCRFWRLTQSKIASAFAMWSLDTRKSSNCILPRACAFLANRSYVRYSSFSFHKCKTCFCQRLRNARRRLYAAHHGFYYSCKHGKPTVSWSRARLKRAHFVCVLYFTIAL